MSKDLIENLQNELEENEEKIEVVNDPLNEFVNESVNEVVNDEKTPLTANNSPDTANSNYTVNDTVNEVVNAPVNDFVNDENESVEEEEETPENGQPKSDEDWMKELDDEPQIQETNENPLNDFIEQPSTTAKPEEKIKQVNGDSKKNLDNLATLGKMGLDMLDAWKAQLCSAIGGDHPAEYTSEEKHKEALLAAFQEYLRSQEFKAPTPFGTLMIALAIWGLPSISMAFMQKYEFLPSARSEQKKREAEQATAEAKTDYSHLKEFKEGRRLFTIHKTKGTYNRSPKGTFSAIDVSDEYPSPEIQALIDQGKTSPEIRTLLYGE